MGAPTSGPASTAEGVRNSSYIGGTVDDNGWEYEYDPDETEDFYFTLDVSAYSPEAATKAARTKRKYQSSARKKPQAGRARTSEASGERADSENPMTRNGNTISSTEALQKGRLQVLDLHSANPLIMLDETLYSCQWSTDLGTQFHLTRRGAVKNPLRPGYVLDVVGTTRARLIGKQMTFRRREEAREVDGVSTLNETDIDIANDNPHEANGETDTGVKNVANTSGETPSAHQSAPESQATRFAAFRKQTKDPALKAQASFLERLSLIKEKKGETDKVPFFGVKNYVVPENKDEIRAKALAAEAENRKDSRGGKIGKRASNKHQQACAIDLTEDTWTSSRKKQRSSTTQSAEELTGVVDESTATIIDNVTPLARALGQEEAGTNGFEGTADQETKDVNRDDSQMHDNVELAPEVVTDVDGKTTDHDAETMQGLNNT